jgi:hypothetical protein
VRLVVGTASAAGQRPLVVVGCPLLRVAITDGRPGRTRAGPVRRLKAATVRRRAPELDAPVVGMMLGAFLDVTAYALTREHRWMLDSPLPSVVACHPVHP